MEPNSSRSMLNELLSIWGRRKSLALTALAAAAAGGFSLVAALPSVYRSKATVLVERDEPPTELTAAGPRHDELDIQLKVVNREVLSRARLEPLIERFQLYPEMSPNAPRGPYVERMRRAISLEVETAAPAWGRDSTIAFSIGFQGTDRDKVAAVTNALAEQFVQQNAETQQRTSAGSSEVVADQVHDVERRLKEQERRIAAFKQNHLGELPDQVTTNLHTLERLNTQLQVNRDRQFRALDARPEPGRPAPAGAASASAQLARLKDERAELRTHFSDSYPDVIAVTHRIEALERQLAERPRSEPRSGAPAAAPAGNDVPSLEQEERELRRSIAEYQRRVDQAPQYEGELQELTRDYDATKELYHSMLQRGEELNLAGRVERQLSQGRFRVLEPAVPEPLPWGPDRRKLLLAGLVLATLFSAGVVLLAEQLDSSFHSASALRAFCDVPILASVPSIVTAADRRRSRRRAVLWVGAAAACLALLIVMGQRLAHGNEGLALMLSRGHG